MRYGAARKNGTAFPSIETLARKTGMSERSVQVYFKETDRKKNCLSNKHVFQKIKADKQYLYYL